MTYQTVTAAETDAAKTIVRRNARQYKSGFGGVCVVCRKPVAAASVEVIEDESGEWHIVGRDCKKRLRAQ